MITGFQFFVIGVVFLGFAIGVFSSGFKKKATQKQNYFFTTLGILLAIPFVIFCSIGFCKGAFFEETSLALDLIFLFLVLAVGFLCGFFLPWVGIICVVVYSFLLVSFMFSLREASPSANFAKRVELESPLENPDFITFQVLQIPRYLPFPVGESWVCCSDSRFADSSTFDLGLWSFVLDFLNSVQNNNLFYTRKVSDSSDLLIKTFEVTLPETPFSPLIYSVEFKNSCFWAKILPY